MIFDVHRGSVHDGPGIRTVIFFKGCSMKCFWCQNPESQLFEKEIAHYDEKCVYCLKCIENCVVKAISYNNKFVIDNNKCNKCGVCEANCNKEAIKIIGKDYTTDEIIKIIKKDIDFYKISGGGITLSGGECLLQEQAFEIAEEAKKNDINVIVETCGNVSKNAIKRIVPFCDLFLYDIKTTDIQKHVKACGTSPNKIIDNLNYLKDTCPEKIQIRMCIVPGFNDNEQEIYNLKKISEGLKKPILLPFHNWAKNKYEALNRKYDAADYPLVTREDIEKLSLIL